MKHHLLFLAGTAAATTLKIDPIVQVPFTSASYSGVYLPTFKQDAFLGINFAPEPRRFTPATLATPSGHTDAKKYGNSCPAYGGDTDYIKGISEMKEDCLNLNIVRPSGIHGNLPVMVWIYGGGWQMGSNADPRYNLSYIVEQSVLSGKPVIGVSINYRLAGFGFLYSQEVANSGNTNLGLRDQRTALQWIQKYIRSFGGDPRKVTIWGESAGGYSVGNHLLAYGGKDEGLFRSAILQSGTAVGPPVNDSRWYQPLYNKVTAAVGCSEAFDTLECLRGIPYDAMYKALNVGPEWFATVDGDMIRSWPTTAEHAGKMVKVPLLLGSNTDEGTSFGSKGINTDEQAVAALISSKRWLMTKSQAAHLWSLYSTNPALGCPYGTGNATFSENGLQYKRYSSVSGDLSMDAPRRLLAETASGLGSPVFSYRFDANLPNNTKAIGVGHFQDVPFVFSNPVQTFAPLGNDTARLALAHKMARFWTAFAHDGNPGAEWPAYTKEKPQNMVLRTDKSYVEADTYRVTAMKYINSMLR
ncbi:Alpha/Beta hydrolase protein [Pyronema domesticum]|uniref:Carboxylic ester hydrolase n=1 Tax=Pyronema omphalodes (strain CBS 100304) TaxID=1076935 RepID=U4LFU9_PYROM|nr:Alpha/Beta hydrolase protein [Pyronema domesticum]CCX14327.1 Similar to Lipase 4; acc. no. P32948 [Pyronema omphalodes CBS 100304]